MAPANKQQQQDEPDDSEEEDEDYVPTAQGDESDDDDGGDGCNGEIGITAPQLSYRKQRAVDDAFASLFGVKTSAAEKFSTDDDDAKNDGSKKRKVVSSASPSSKKMKKRKVGGGREGGKKSSKKMRRQQRVLAEMFGPSAAADLLSTAGRVVEADELRRRNRRALGEGDIAGLPSVGKETVIEVKRFAGRDVTVQKVVNSGGIVASSATPAFARKGAPASMPTQKQSAASAGGGLDAVLTEMKGPQKMSTVEKTGADWETFKEQIGGAELKDELEQKAKGKEAYLEKKDFLTRVDLRRFDREKAERDIQRSQRSGGGGRKG